MLWRPSIPLRTAERKTMGNIVLVSAVVLIDAQNRVLLAQRPKGKAMEGLWEFPGGKVDAGETPEEALVRELHEELDIVVLLGDLQPLTFASHSYEKFHLLMPLFACSKWQGTPHPREGQKLAWAAKQEWKNYAMPPADNVILSILEKLL